MLNNFDLYDVRSEAIFDQKIAFLKETITNGFWTFITFLYRIIKHSILHLKF